MVLAGSRRWRMKNGGCLEWLAHPLSQAEDSEGCSIGIYTVPGWLITHLGRKFNSELRDTHRHFLGAALVPTSTMGKLRSYFPPGLHASARSWQLGSPVKWKCECVSILPGEKHLPPWVWGAVKERLWDIALQPPLQELITRQSVRAAGAHQFTLCDFKYRLELWSPNCLIFSHILK